MDRERFWRFAYGFLFTFAAAALLIIVPFVYRSGELIEHHLAGNRWALPSTIYASAPVLQPGKAVTPDWLIDYFQRLDYQKTSGAIIRTGQYSISNEGIAFRKSSVLDPGKENSTVLVQFNQKGIRRLLDFQTRQELPYYSLEPVAISNLFGDQWEKRMLVSLKELPPNMINAVLAVEDRRFYEHSGVDVRAIARALWQNIMHREQLQGASTITQQLVKNFYLTPERSLRRKVSEAIMSMMLETKLKKQEILELYLNEVYLGQRGTMSINGVGAASRLYFHKDVRNISLPEAALLAGLIRAPSAYNPYRHPEEAKNRRNTVLMIMKETGVITEEQLKQASVAPIHVYPIDTRVNLAPYFGDLVKEQLLAKYKPENIYNEDLHVFTTIDLDMQEAAEAALSSGLAQIDRVRFRRAKKGIQGCLIAIEPQTGYIRAFVGGRSYSKSQFDRISHASRQPGSSFKPIVYAAALEMAFQGNSSFTPATLIADEPAVFHYQNIVWEPKNYDGEYHGIVTMRNALAQSMNVATAKLAENIGLQQIVDLANQMGFESLKPYPSLPLGVFEISPWQLAEAYTVFANGGMKTELQAIQKVTDMHGKMLERPQPEAKQVLHPETAYLITDILKTAMISGTAAASRRMGFMRPAAGKTGTTNDFRDAWFIGYTPNLICLVWTGYDDNTTIGMNGAQAALPIWVRFMKRATEFLPATDFQRPADIVAKDIDPTTGKLAGDFCPEVITELFIAGTEPLQQCTEADHYSIQALDFSNESGLIQQVEQEGNEVPQVYTYSNDANTEVEQPQTEPEQSQHIYIAPDPEVHRILTQDNDEESQQPKTQPDSHIDSEEESPQTQTQPN